MGQWNKRRLLVNEIVPKGENEEKEYWLLNTMVGRDMVTINFVVFLDLYLLIDAQIKARGGSKIQFLNHVLIDYFTRYQIIPPRPTPALTQ